jgi:NAD-dependent deacetylase sirtuin 4
MTLVSDRARPDGDLDLGDAKYEHFHVPSCGLCGGIVKPSVVFFGENVPLDVVNRAMTAVQHSDGILVFGSSLQVFSAYRFIKLAHEKKLPYGIVNIGPTRGDEGAVFKIEDRVGSILPLVVEKLKNEHHVQNNR